MKTRLVLLTFIILGTACSEYSCPTYGSNPTYTFSSPKRKTVKSRSSASVKKPAKKAEQ